MKKIFLFFIFICNYTMGSSFSKAMCSLNIDEYAYNSNEIKLNYSDPIDVKKEKGKAEVTFKAIEKKDSWVDSFSSEEIQELPIGVKYTLGNVQYCLGVTKAVVNKDFTELTVFARVRLPQSSSDGSPVELFFGADHVKMSHKGGLVGDVNLVLLGDIDIPMSSGNMVLTLKGGFNYKKGTIDDKTYVKIGCEGVEEMKLDAEIQFSRKLILPIDEKGKVDNKPISIMTTNENGSTIKKNVLPTVRGAFKAEATDWNDLLVKISLQPFVLATKRNTTDYKSNFQFLINEAVLDFSDKRNDKSVLFPEVYRTNNLLVPTENSWRGVYVNTLEVAMPEEFKTSDSEKNNKRVSFAAHHLLIDGHGVSGNFSATNLFTLDKGITSKKKAWAYSVDSISIKIAANKLISAGFKGQIQLPVSPPEKNAEGKTERRKGTLTYKGLISEEEYLLTVKNDSTIDFNLWKAKAQLLPNSLIELKVKDGKFKPKAILNGRMAISASQKSSLQNEGKEIKGKEGEEKKFVEFKGIEFQNMVLQSESPAFSVEYLGYKDKVSFGGFPVSISDIKMKYTEESANLYFDLAINLMGGKPGFGAKTTLGIIGKFSEENYLQKWKFEKIDLKKINIEADLGAFKIDGSLEIMSDDPEYGNGFAGELTIDFKKLKSKVKAKGVFGKTKFRYWQFEAMADFPPLGAGVFSLTGFAGGASYKMKKTGFGSSFSPTGIGYTPDESKSLGLKALVKFVVPKKETFAGNAGFEVTFNKHGGVDFLGFYGQGTLLGVEIPGMEKINGLMGELQKQADKSTKFLGMDGKEKLGNTFVGKNLLDVAESDFPKISDKDKAKKMQIVADLGITYDFTNSTLHGELDTKINVPGGFITGGGRSVIHYSPEEWYIYIGKPNDRINLKIGFGSVSLKTGGYFMTGSVLPDSPPPPPEVASILGLSADKLDYMRSENSLKSGSGFAFGSNLSIDTGDLKFLMFYARFQAGTGFDIMLRNYGKTECSNTGKQVGINGWYANGQAYVYLQGELGIRVKLFFVKKKITIIKGAAAAILQAKAPNPVWMKGYVGGEYDLLGGLVKGRFRFKLELGEQCSFGENAPLGGMKIITDVSPEKDSKDVDVFNIPQAAFSMRIGQDIVIPEDNGDKTYRVILDEFKVLDEGKEIKGKLEWNDTFDRVNFMAEDILPPNKKLTARVKVTFQEKKDGVFTTIMVEGKPAKEIEERIFKTGGAPSYIPLHNIVYSYPVVGQHFFLEKETNKGYVKLGKGQDYLFDNKAWNSFISVTKGEEKLKELPFSYDAALNQVNFDMPNVEQSKDYELLIFSKSKSKSTIKTEKVVDVKKMKENDVKIKSNKASTLIKEGGFERLKYNFTTSKYKTFKSKVKSITTKDYFVGAIYSDVIYLTNTIKEHEVFDKAELAGVLHSNNTPLISIEATLDDSYFKEDIKPNLYQNYPLAGKYTITNRDINLLGIPPRKAVEIKSYYLTYLDYGINVPDLKTAFPYSYNQAFFYKQDWVDLQSQIVNDYTDGVFSNSSALKIMNSDFMPMRYESYKTKLTYRLPNGELGTSVKYEFKNKR